MVVGSFQHPCHAFDILLLNNQLLEPIRTMCVAKTISTFGRVSVIMLTYLARLLSARVITRPIDTIYTYCIYMYILLRIITVPIIRVSNRITIICEVDVMFLL